MSNAEIVNSRLEEISLRIDSLLKEYFKDIKTFVVLIEDSDGYMRIGKLNTNHTHLVREIMARIDTKNLADEISSNFRKVK